MGDGNPMGLSNRKVHSHRAAQHPLTKITEKSRSVQHELLVSLLSLCKNTSQVSSCKHSPFLLFEEQSSLLNTFKAKLFSCLKHHSYHVILFLQSVSHLRAFARATPFPSPASARLVSSHLSGLTYSERPCLNTPTQSCSWPLTLYLYMLFLVELLL